MRQLIPLVGIIYFLVGCTPHCEKSAYNWKYNAPKRLHDFVPAGYEIIKHHRHLPQSEYWLSENDSLDKKYFPQLKKY